MFWNPCVISSLCLLFSCWCDRANNQLQLFMDALLALAYFRSLCKITICYNSVQIPKNSAQLSNVVGRWTQCPLNFWDEEAPFGSCIHKPQTSAASPGRWIHVRGCTVSGRWEWCGFYSYEQYWVLRLQEGCDKGRRRCSSPPWCTSRRLRHNSCL